MMTRSDKTLRATAHHEAGHAVVAFFLGRGFKYATIVPGEGTLGHVRMDRTPKWALDEFALGSRALKQREFWENDVMISFAGKISQQKHLGRRVRYGHEADIYSTLDWHLRFGGEDSRVHIHWSRWLHAQAAAIVDSRWPEIQAVASALIDRKRLSREEIRLIIIADDAGRRRAHARIYRQSEARRRSELQDLLARKKKAGAKAKGK